MIGAMDREAQRLGVTRQSVIKMWIVDAQFRASLGNLLPNASSI